MVEGGRKDESKLITMLLGGCWMYNYKVCWHIHHKTDAVSSPFFVPKWPETQLSITIWFDKRLHNVLFGLAISFTCQLVTAFHQISHQLLFTILTAVVILGCVMCDNNLEGVTGATVFRVGQSAATKNLMLPWNIFRF